MFEGFEIHLTDLKNLTNRPGPVVVVDDDASQERLVKIFHKHAKCEVELICLRNAQEFFVYLDNIDLGITKLPKLVLLDINMPKINGLEVLKTVRSNEKFKDIPIIIMLSSSDSIHDKQQALELRANAFITKPSEASEYIEFFKNL